MSAKADSWLKAREPRFQSLALMPKHLKKGDLPQKVCARCERPFVWRKKWAKVWDEVKYCSERCRNSKPNSGGTQQE